MERFIKCHFSEDHWIGDNGTVKCTRKGYISRYKTNIMSGLIKQDGYKMYWIGNKFYYAHRLVAIHFIPNLLNKSDVNHYDGNKLNNSVDNLEWCTKSENHLHRFKVLGHKIPSGQAHWLHGNKVSDSTRKAMSEQKTGEKHPKFKGWYCYNSNKYASTYDAAKATGFNYKTLLRYSMLGLKGWNFKPIK